MTLASALYRGEVRHRRHAPRQHAFNYRTSLLLLDLDEQAAVFGLSWLWSGRWYSPMRFRELDYLRDQRADDESLKACAQRLVQEQLGVCADGAVQLLTQVRSFGLVFNPVSFFYCHDRAGQLQAIIAEVTNTPWRERFCYLIKADPQRSEQRVETRKAFHVSPFLPADLDYRMRFSQPAQRLRVHMEDWQGEQRLFDATLSLERTPLSASLLRSEACSFPFMVLKTVSAIYWQAARLLIKRTPIFDHQQAEHSLQTSSAVIVKEQSDETQQPR
ncbi:hypothetical protein SAMN05216271_3150 [Halopseudomonas sabulinigri]|uniref:DUF1365 domain-containing protein n=1 Tax=Halopseudomonas sabulinigri TaxID=472181 RepID=A0A1H1W9V3_9GAMM|nr:DUF1365 domain-containing protein [Halopseudomonas sabulinigri]SDS93825.1 hypothetical protein SAMN05216271_3150 [Halopseudomonas sabulinigri]